MTDAPTKIAVKREGTTLGWHWILRENYDPKVHVLHQLHPLDHDADGKPGGSLPEHVREPADYELGLREKPKRGRKKA